VTQAQIESVVGPVSIFRGHTIAEVAATSPGQQAKHYAPTAPTWRFERSQTESALALAGPLDGVLARPASIERLTGRVAASRALVDDPIAAAHDVYAALRELDAASPRAILIEMPPDEPRWAAVRDRLTRAARPIEEWSG
jgi:L-threonylcarbamoyladenylate synthase